MAPRLLQIIFFLFVFSIGFCARAQDSSLLDLVLRTDVESESEAATPAAALSRHEAHEAVVPAAESSEDMPLLVSFVAYVLPDQAAHLPLLAAARPRLKPRPVARCLWSESSSTPSTSTEN